MSPWVCSCRHLKVFFTDWFLYIWLTNHITLLETENNKVHSNFVIIFVRICSKWGRFFVTLQIQEKKRHFATVDLCGAIGYFTQGYDGFINFLLVFPCFYVYLMLIHPIIYLWCNLLRKYNGLEAISLWGSGIYDSGSR